MYMHMHMHERDEKYIQNLARRPEGTTPLGRPRCTWGYIGMDFREIGWESVDWMHLAYDRDQWRAAVKTETNLRPP
jgi:hypothetical protein